MSDSQDAGVGDSSSFLPGDVPGSDVLEAIKPGDSSSHEEESTSKTPSTSPGQSDKSGDEKEKENENVPDEPPIEVPTNPPFDPVIGFILGSYAFRAYSNPPEKAHREDFKSIATNHAKEEPEEELISVSFCYPHIPMIAGDATGVFMFTVRDDATDEGDMPDDLDKMHLTATLNSTSIEIDTSFPSSFTVLRLQESPLNSKKSDDVLTIYLCGSSDALKKGQLATHVAEVSLAELVKTATEHKKSYSVQTEALRFRELNEDDKKKNYFQTSKLSPKLKEISSEMTNISPEGGLPFSTPSPDESCLPDQDIGKVPLTLDISYVPVSSSDLKQAIRECDKNKEEGEGEGKGEDKKDKEFVEDVRNAADTVHDFESVGEFERGNAVSVDERDNQSKSKFGSMHESFFKDGSKDNAEAFHQAAECLNDLALGKEGSDDGEGSKNGSEGNSENGDSDKEKGETEKFVQGVGEKLEGSAHKVGKEAQKAVPSPVTSTFKDMSVPDAGAFFQEHVQSSLAMPEAKDWIRMSSVAKVLIESTGVLPYERSKDLVADAAGCLFLQSVATNTQIWFFVDEKNKCVVVSFRGTEQSSVKDGLTDAQLFMQCWTPGEEIRLDICTELTVGIPAFLPKGFGVREKLEEEGESMDKDRCAIHYGFLQAYKSIQEPLHRAIKLLSEDLSEEYSFFLTGHSLGGALATVAALDMQEKYNLGADRLCVMSFGAPKVGNMNFARGFNKRVPNAFRIINDKDAIAHLPESNSDYSALFRYAHAGRIVLMSENGDYWIEGVHDVDGNLVFDREEEGKEGAGTQEGWDDISMDKRSPWSGGSGDIEKMMQLDHDSPLEPKSMSSAIQHMVRC